MWTKPIIYQRNMKENSISENVNLKYKSRNELNSFHRQWKSCFFQKLFDCSLQDFFSQIPGLFWKIFLPCTVDRKQRLQDSFHYLKVWIYSWHKQPVFALHLLKTLIGQHFHSAHTDSTELGTSTSEYNNKLTLYHLGAAIQYK